MDQISHDLSIYLSNLPARKVNFRLAHRSYKIHQLRQKRLASFVLIPTPMNRKWLRWIIVISFGLICIQKTQELKTLRPFWRPEKVIKLSHFKEAQKRLNSTDRDLLELWESMLTGRSAPLSKHLKEKYQILGLKHIFTPSGFHLSAVLTPLLKVVKHDFIVITLLGIILSFLPGLGALKRMLLIKGTQKIWGQRIGFISALIIDCLFGTFQNSPLSFTFSFLFLGIIYSGVSGAGLTFWFFLAQAIICYFHGQFLSPLLLIFGPILNFGFAIILPALFVLSYPLYEWQVDTGIYLLKTLQVVVDVFANGLIYLPSWEIHLGTLVLLWLFITRKFFYLTLGMFFWCSSLNLDLARIPGPGSYEYVGGRCRRELIRGYWWEKCAPLRERKR